MPACPMAYPQRAVRLLLGLSPSMVKEALESFNNKKDVKIKQKFVIMFSGSEKKYKLVLSQ